MDGRTNRRTDGQTLTARVHANRVRCALKIKTRRSKNRQENSDETVVQYTVHSVMAVHASTVLSFVGFCLLPLELDDYVLLPLTNLCHLTVVVVYTVYCMRACMMYVCMYDVFSLFCLLMYSADL